MSAATTSEASSLATTPIPDPDHELVEQTRTGDLAAFEVLVVRHQDVVRRVAARIVGGDEADDVAQDAFVRAFHRLDRFRGDAPFRSWLLRIVHNRALDTVAQRRERPSASQAESDRSATVLHSGELREPADELEASERRERLTAKLRLVPEQHRAVLVLRDLEGFSYDEIAAITDAPLGSVKGRVHRARQEMVALLRANTYDWGLPDD